MIQSIVLEFLDPGALPVFDIAERGLYHVLDFGDPLDVYTQEGTWRPLAARHTRLVVPLNIDTDNATVFTQVPLWVQQAQHFRGEGTLIFVVRTAATFEDGTSLILAGMAYSETPVEGAIPLTGINPTDLIIQLLHNNRQHPIVRQALDRHDAQTRESRRYWVMAEEARRIEKRKARHAEKRANKLLDRHLTHKQRRWLKTKSCIPVLGQDGRTYHIEKRSHQNVFLIEGNLRVTQFCLVSSIHMPVADLLLAQKLLLESDIEHFMKIANQWDLRNGPRVRTIRIPGIEIDLFHEVNALEDLRAREAPPRLGPPIAYMNIDGVERMQMGEAPPIPVFEPEQLDEAV